MSRFIRLQGTRFNNPDLPILRVFDQDILALAGLKGWFKDPGSITDDGTMRWANAVIGGGDFIQSNASLKPAILQNAVNGKAALTWDGTDAQVMSWEGSPVTTGAVSMIAVSRHRTAIAASNVPNVLSVPPVSPGEGGIVLRFDYAGLDDYAFNVDGTSVLSSAVDEEFVLALASYDPVSGDAKIAVNNDDPTVSAVPTPDTGLGDSLQMGATSSSGTQNPWNGEIAEVFYFESDIFAAGRETDLALIRDYVSAKFGIGAAA